MWAANIRRRALPWLLAVAIATAGSRANVAYAVDQAAELDKGQKLYIAGKHQDVDLFFQNAVDGGSPSITDASLVQSARMIRGASEFQLGRQADARLQWEKILRININFAPDPLLFSPSIIQEFDRLRARIKEENATKAGLVDAKLLAAEKDARLRLSAKYDALKTFASTERVVTRRSRLIASLPFGIGQFQNGDDGLGATFLTLEAVFAATSIGTAAYWSTIPGVKANQGVESGVKIFNWISTGTFLALAVGGIVHAHLAFRGDTSELRPRKLPPQLALQWAPTFEAGRDGARMGVVVLF